MNQLTIAYLAGLFDGEGCFLIAKSKVNKKHSSRPFRFQAYAILQIRQKIVCDLLQKTFGGTVSLVRRKNPKHSDIYKWLGSGKTLDKILLHLEPFLIIKKEQAVVLLDFQSVKSATGNRPISDINYFKSEMLYNQIRLLNRRGPT